MAHFLLFFSFLFFSFLSLCAAAVNERFFALTAVDQDSGANGQVSYSITQGNEAGKFGIFPDGLLYVRNPLDREIKDYYGLTVVAQDAGSPW